jgi:hypothetical protein
VAQNEVEKRVEVRLRGAHLDAVARELDGRLEQDPPRKCPEEPVRLLEAGRGPGDGARGGTDPELLSRPAREVHVHHLHGGALAGREAETGGGGEEVEQARSTVGGAVDEHEAAASRPGKRALGDP